MFRKFARAAAVLAACAALAGVQVGTAHAAGPSVLGGGSGIVVNDQGVCTLTTIGHDAAGRLVGITAGHCNDAGNTVTAEANRDAGVVGTFAYSNRDMDYAVIAFDADKVVPVNRVGNTTITGLGGPAQFPDVACKEGYTTGQTCGLAYGDLDQTNTWTWTQICVLPGDSGAPVVVGTTLVGMVNGYLRVPCLGPELGANIATIIDDINARGGIGSGFHPI
ncbi:MULTISPECIES: S1 family peptidase [unclassified Nocardia]|uniref:S1 family peptidase n=1 Tax=unclassified Nocardia TaxID=2637762 RepID=UPI0034141077